jgi:UTP--glucose-1-phosphate uridylyltransferase
MRVRHAVFPVAGLGTRLLPATKVLAKEMLPIIDRPLIQYAVDEAVAAGCETLVFVSNRYKHSIQDYFDTAFELEHKLTRGNKKAELDAIRDILPPGINTVFVTQQEALGLGHAVLCAKSVVGDNPFAVLLPDDLIVNRARPALRQMIEMLAKHPGSAVAVEEVPRDQTHRYGIVSAVAIDDRIARLHGVVEKPKADAAPSNLAIVGRYVLSGRIFELLERTKPGAGGEIQLTDAIAALIEEAPVYAYRFEGRRYDCGNKFGVVRATIELALEDPSISSQVRALMREVGARSEG